MDWTSVYTAVILGIATSIISVTITRARVFREVRMFLDGRNEWLHSLFKCSYCMSHWVSAALVIAFDLRLTRTMHVLDIIVSIFVVVGLATVSSGAILRLNHFSDDPPRLGPAADEDSEDVNTNFNDPGNQPERRAER